ncbi:hypothetical protein COV12_00595 [Candidatus Woesearchaeota archaeon CG10_big_fil_rev_8_21_14_0_10_32_24]|nr:MAG: hypothetical protein COV12_00595 [Candidatus Woesearchaeota archaeon CG10_big_fil_rev_8_21_14_0_10_32_24]
MIIKTTPDREKAESILKMVNTTLEMVASLDSKKFPSHVTKEYYDIMRELLSIILLLDGYKTVGEGAHKELIEYFVNPVSNLSEEDLTLIDNLRIIRNRISYDGFFVTQDYLERNKGTFLSIINKLKKMVGSKLR